MSVQYQIKNFDALDWIIVPGGPALSASYLKYGLEPFLSDLKLHFYDPLGTPEAPVANTPSIDDLVQQIIETAEKNNLKDYGLITHSFGNYLALKALTEKKTQISALLMISPMPFTSKNWHRAIKHLLEKIPKPILDKMEELAQQSGNDLEIFELCLPYYMAKPVKIPQFPFDFKVCNSIVGQVGEYDFTSLILSNRLPPWVCIMGEADPFFIERELFATNIIIIPNVGHYPFFENSEEFARAIGQIRTTKCPVI